MEAIKFRFPLVIVSTEKTKPLTELIESLTEDPERVIGTFGNAKTVLALEYSHISPSS